MVVKHMNGLMGGIPEKLWKIGGKNEKETHESSQYSCCTATG